MVFFRNVQVRRTPLRGVTIVMVAIGRPGASGDHGVYQDRVEPQVVQARFPLPDLTGAVKNGQRWGYVRMGGALRCLKWDDTNTDQYDLAGSTTGWGLARNSGGHHVC
jgi:hypothetical protein